MTRKIVKHLDAHGRAKASPKTKSYALDANTVEDPGIVRSADAGGGEGDFEDMMGPDLDDDEKLKPGDAPIEVYHSLSSEERIKALLFHRQRTTKFVKEMVDNGLLKILASEASVTAECDSTNQRTVVSPTAHDQIRQRGDRQRLVEDPCFRRISDR